MKKTETVRGSEPFYKVVKKFKMGRKIYSAGHVFYLISIEKKTSEEEKMPDKIFTLKSFYTGEQYKFSEHSVKKHFRNIRREEL